MIEMRLVRGDPNFNAVYVATCVSLIRRRCGGQAQPHLHRAGDVAIVSLDRPGSGTVQEV